MIPGGPGLYEELMRRRMGPQAAPQPQPQGPVMPALPPDPQDYLAQLLAQSQVPVKPPSTLDRLRAGVQVPDTKIVKPKGRIARLALRGLVGGFKNSGDTQYDAKGKPVSGGRAGGSAGGLTPYQAASLQYRASADRRAEANEARRDATLANILENTKHDNQVQDTMLPITIENIEADNKRADAALRVSQRRLALAEQAAARAAKASKNGTSGSYTARKQYWDAQADVIEAQIDAKFETDTASLRPTSKAFREAKAARDSAIQKTKAWRARQIQTLSAQEMERKGDVNPEPSLPPSMPELPDGLDEEDFD